MIGLIASFVIPAILGYIYAALFGRAGYTNSTSEGASFGTAPEPATVINPSTGYPMMGKSGVDVSGHTWNN